MTLIVGIQCRNGVVVAADSAATLSDGDHYTVGQLPVAKLHDLAGTGIFAATGSIGAAQQICNSLRSLVKGGSLATGAQTAEDAMAVLGGHVGKTLAPMFEQARNVLPLVGQQRAGENVLCRSLVAIPVTRQRIPVLFQLVESGVAELTTRTLCFAAMGSGQPIADPFLAFLKRVLWSDRVPELNEGRFAAAWTIEHVALTNTGGVALPLQLATLTVDAKGVASVEFANETALQEHHQAIEGAERTLRGYLTKSDGEGVPEDIPTPGPEA